MNLSIVIISWNTRELLDRCIESIYASVKNIKFEIIVVDNASSDDSLEMLKDKYKDVIIICNDINYGFAKANNIGVKRASGEIILLLNSDTLVMDNSIDCAIKESDNEEVGMLVPMVLNSDGTLQHPCYVTNISIQTELINAIPSKILKWINYKRRDISYDVNKQQFVSHGCGCCLFIKKSVLNKLDYLFDENMPFSYEDADLCMRVKIASYKILHLPSSKIIHYGGGSRSEFNPVINERVILSKFSFFRKHYGYSGTFKLWFILILKSVIYFLLSIKYLGNNKIYKKEVLDNSYNIYLLLKMVFSKL